MGHASDPLETLRRDSDANVVVGVSLVVRSNPSGPHVPPRDVEAVMPVPGSEHVEVGEPTRRLGGEPSPRSLWAWHSKRVVTLDVAGRVEEALALLLPAAKDLRALTTQWDAEVLLVVSVLATTDLTAAGEAGAYPMAPLALPPSTLGKLLTLGATLLVSPVVLQEQTPRD